MRKKIEYIDTAKRKAIVKIIRLEAHQKEGNDETKKNRPNKYYISHALNLNHVNTQLYLNVMSLRQSSSEKKNIFFKKSNVVFKFIHKKKRRKEKKQRKETSNRDK